ncbi:MAG: ribonuclease HII [Clostridium sp.]|nr:ribonuclease HII [Clostridium sp.]MCM1444134.1 ribonuclease HII [Candidatus Amulumruptor caecigallinarius]
MENIDNYKYEKELWQQGFNNIAGVDEVGRGPLIGPVVTACVVLPKDFKLEGLTDSKKLSEKKRNIFADYIKDNCIAYSIGIVSPEEIDEINIYEASRKAMINAIKEVRNKVQVDYVLSDAMPIDMDIPVMPITKGDLKSVTIAAASVIAKVTRDEMMYELSKKYPMYGFDKHKGYPTKKHIEALKQYGLIDGYRKTYGPVKEILERNK